MKTALTHLSIFFHTTLIAACFCFYNWCKVEEARHFKQTAEYVALASNEANPVTQRKHK